MDIILNKDIEYDALKAFLEKQFADLDLFLVYEGVDDWGNVENQQLIFEYNVDNEIDKGFKYGLIVGVKHKNICALLEKLSSEISRSFECSAICDASRIVLKKPNVYYSLLFERGKVYLVDDILFEETGNVTKLIEMQYKIPEYDLG